MFLCEHGSPIDQSAYDLKLKANAEETEILFMSGQRFGELQLAFPFGELVGELSRWNTLRVLRVLRWYERSTGTYRYPLLAQTVEVCATSNFFRGTL
jgi:hypothetical protein